MPAVPRLPVGGALCHQTQCTLSRSYRRLEGGPCGRWRRHRRGEPNGLHQSPGGTSCWPGGWWEETHKGEITLLIGWALVLGTWSQRGCPTGSSGCPSFPEPPCLRICSEVCHHHLPKTRKFRNSINLNSKVQRQYLKIISKMLIFRKS